MLRFQFLKLGSKILVFIRRVFIPLVVELSMKIYGAFLKSFVCITLRDRTKGFKRHLGLKLCETKQFRCIQCRNYLIVSSSPNSPPLLLILTLLVYSIGRYFLSSLHSRIENFVRSDEFSFFITNPHGNNHPPAPHANYDMILVVISGAVSNYFRHKKTGYFVKLLPK